MGDKLKELLSTLNEKGICLPFLRDPDKRPPSSSVSLTMMAVSFTICVVGLIGRSAHFFDIDKNEAYNLLILTSSLYFGRKLTTKNGTIDAKSDDPNKDKS